VSTVEPIELRVVREGATVKLLSPSVGLFTEQLAEGQVLAAGQAAGALIVLGRVVRLRVPADVTGRIVGPAHERVQMPVGYGDVLYELAPLSASDAAASHTNAASASNSNALVLRAPQSGRFYHRAAPGEPAFVAQGQVVSEGQPIGLIEVMKTFNHVVYRATSSLPPRAKIAKLVAADGAEVRAGDVLLELESA
jgi:biotin carboxyl carrier protein